MRKRFKVEFDYSETQVVDGRIREQKKRMMGNIQCALKRVDWGWDVAIANISITETKEVPK